MPSVLITGASKGIGRAIAAEFADRGYRVVATARNPETLANLPVDARLALDVTDQASVASAVAPAGDVDVLIANAGVIFYAAVEARIAGNRGRSVRDSSGTVGAGGDQLRRAR